MLLKHVGVKSNMVVLNQDFLELYGECWFIIIQSIWDLHVLVVDKIMIFQFTYRLKGFELSKKEDYIFKPHGSYSPSEVRP